VEVVEMGEAEVCHEEVQRVGKVKIVQKELHRMIVSATRYQDLALWHELSMHPYVAPQRQYRYRSRLHIQ